ncbi:MAG: hypothetical protein KDA37_08130 [Planctomycetales bacterium]|nr:hypothetical protein [Planctomycetales bacterium]
MPATRTTLVAACCWFLLAFQVLAQEAVNAELRANAPPTPSAAVRTDTDLFWHMLDFQNRQTNKELALLYNHEAWGDQELVVVVGGQARLSALAASTNREGKFPYQGRFPTDFVGDTATDARLLHANAALAVHACSWINVYGELLFSDVFTFPDHKQGSLQTRQAYAVFGDLEQCPWYAFLGKKNLPFGDMGSLSPFSQSMVWHYFGALGEGVGAGYKGEYAELTLMGVNGGRQIRAADSEEKGKLNNLAANALFTIPAGEDCYVRFGGGYLLGTIYDGAFPEHLDPNQFGEYNSAWNLNMLMRWGRWTFAGEHTQTVRAWPSTGHEVTAARAEAGYDLNVLGYPSRASVSWSEGIQGDSGTEFQFNQQLVLGLGVTLNPYALLSLEYVRSAGFAPLIDITTVSDRSVVQHTALGGLTLVF